MTPFWSTDTITLYHGDARLIAPRLGGCDAVITDPPYGEISYGWDRWPEGWPGWFSADQLWCFTSLRTLLSRAGDFTAAGWQLGQEIVWEKHNGSSAATDRFRRVHELVVHWYRGRWSGLHHRVPRIPAPEGRSRGGTVSRKNKPEHWHGIGAGNYVYGDTRMARSVVREKSAQRCAWHPTQKPLGLTRQLVTYSVPAGGLIVDPFCGSGTTLVAAYLEGRRAIGIERAKTFLRAAVQRLELAASGSPEARPW